ncbi:MAG: DUF1349 domain-containing protein [Chloroflexi bacterium]|nr:DUF1349 domain-containing protein [Chloroflexota bacterium]
MTNLLADLKPNRLGSFNWTNPPLGWDLLPGGGIRVRVPARADFFQDPAGRVQADSAPYLWMPVAGDFTARAHIRHAFKSIYDAGVIMVSKDATTWAKLCFEATDFGTHAAVSVVTRGVSDDANGVDLDTDTLWLQVVRRGNVLAMHYAIQPGEWRMVRLFHLDLPDVVQVGLVAQCPTGDGAEIDWLEFRLLEGAPENLRAGK